jgi:transposase
MEDLLDLYEEPYDKKRPVVGFDERPCSLHEDHRKERPAKPKQVAKQDYTYKRQGTANAFMHFEPLAGWRHVEVTEQRTKVDFAEQMKWLCDERYPDAEVIRVVLDNLSTHSKGALYDAFSAEEAHRLSKKLEFHFTPKHGSWLNMAELELSALARQCLWRRRLGTKEALAEEAAAWERTRNQKKVKANWQFRTKDARIKLRRLYPKAAKEDS